MISLKRWEPCVYHRGSHVNQFLQEYLSCADRKILIVQGVGFDPRLIRILELIPDVVRFKAKAILIREERPNSPHTLLKRAERNRDTLARRLPNSCEHCISVFTPDNAVVGGREAVRLINSSSLDGVTDVFIDMSALSIGVGFPIVKRFVRLLNSSPQPRMNLHLMASHNPDIDEAITAHPSDVVTPVHGFRGGWGFDENSRALIFPTFLGRTDKGV